jgi:hypothetical protein
MKRKILSIFLILAALASIAAAPMPAAPHADPARPHLQSRITVESPASGTTVPPNYENLDLVVTIMNTEEAAWPTGYTIRRETGTSSISVGSAIVNPTTAINPGDSATVTVDLVAPAATGTYNEIWTLDDNNGYVMDRFSFSFVVSGDAIVAGEHTEFSQISIGTYPDTDWTFARGQTDQDMWVNVTNMGDSKWAAGYYLQYESGSTHVTGGVTQVVAAEALPGKTNDVTSSHTFWIDLYALNEAGNESANWSLKTADGKVLGRFSFKVYTQDVDWLNPAAMYDATFDIVSPGSDHYYINDPGADLRLYISNNNSVTTWTKDFYLQCVEGTCMTQNSSDNVHPLGTAVPPRSVIGPIVIDLKAPSAAGDYSSTWALKTASGSEIGRFSFTLHVIN